jgi:hypothetical protein
MYPISNPSSATGTSRAAAVANTFAHYLKQAPTLPGGQKAVMCQRMALALADDPCADLETAQHRLSNPDELNEYYTTLGHPAGALK